MASEIRVNTINNRSGLGTITISDTGAVFAGVTTITSLQVTGTLIGVANTDNIRTNTNATFLQNVNVSGAVTSTGMIVTGVTTVAAGSTSAPSISPSGDSNTGIFFPSADTIAFGEGGTELARFDSNGRFGIGTNAPIAATHIMLSDVTGFSSPTNDGLVVERGGGNDLGITIATDNTRNGYLIFADGDSANPAWVGYDHSVNAMSFRVNASERARIDSSGRLLVGTSTAQGQSIFQAVGNSSASTDPGDIRVIRGLSVSSIGTNVGAELGIIKFGALESSVCAQISAVCDANWSTNDFPGRLVFSTTADGASSPTERARINNAGEFSFRNTSYVYPATDNAVSLGLSGFRFSAVWAANGTIQTSDKRAKADIASATLGSDFIKALRPVSYKWIDGGKCDTGERDEDNNYIYESIPGERTHWGFIAQEVKQAVDAAGVDFGGWVLTDKDDPDSQQALRYDQFIAPLTKALQETMAELEALKAEVAALKAS